MNFFKGLIVVMVMAASVAPVSFSGDAPVVHVKVLSGGMIYADNEQVDLKQLADIFSKLKKNSGKVWYYQERIEAKSKSPKESMEVIRLISEYKLPVTFSTKPDDLNFASE